MALGTVATFAYSCTRNGTWDRKYSHRGEIGMLQIPEREEKETSKDNKYTSLL